MTSLASITVPTPTVSACFGTCSTSLSKNRELASIVSCSSYHIWVKGDWRNIGRCTFLIERLHPRPGDQGGARLVEGDVSVGPDSADEELDPARLSDLPLVGVALRLEVGRVAVQQVGVLRLIQSFQIDDLTPEDVEGNSYLNVNVSEEVLPHVGVVALLVGPRQLHVLIHVEGLHILKNEVRDILGDWVTFCIRRVMSLP